jgi:putative copper export protein
MSWPRLLTVGLVSAAVICIALIAGHRLWERPQDPAARERVTLVNHATTLTVALGVVTLLAALLVVTTPPVREAAYGYRSAEDPDRSRRRS